MHGTLGTLHMDTLLEQSLLPDNIGGLVATTVVEVLLAVIEILVEVLTGTLGGKKSVVDVLHHWMEHPVMYFLFGV